LQIAAFLHFLMPSSLQLRLACDIRGLYPRIARPESFLNISGGQVMILQSAELSPSQRAAIEQSVGRKLQDQENIVLCGAVPKVASEAGRQQAAERMRHQLSVLDRCDRRMSIEDCVAAILERSGTESAT
jgi:hypothetical protein